MAGTDGLTGFTKCVTSEILFDKIVHTGVSWMQVFLGTVLGGDGFMDDEKLVAEREEAMREFRKVCCNMGTDIRYDSSVEDGDILFNPLINVAIIGDYINKKNIDAMLNILV